MMGLGRELPGLTLRQKARDLATGHARAHPDANPKASTFPRVIRWSNPSSSPKNYYPNAHLSTSTSLVL